MSNRTPLVIDVQTKADDSRPNLWYKVEKLADPPSPPNILLALTVPDIKDYLKTYGVHLAEQTVDVEDDKGAVCDEVPYLDTLEAEELSAKKPRSTVIEAINEARKAKDELVKQAAIFPETCEVAALSYYAPDENNGAISGGVVGINGWTEHTLLKRFVALLENHGPIVAWNLSDFTLLVLQVRCGLNELPFPKLLDERPWGDDIIDLRRARFPNSFLRPRDERSSLEWMCEAWSVKYPAPAGISGADVEQLLKTDPMQVLAYSKARVYAARELYQKWADLKIFVRNVALAANQHDEEIAEILGNLPSELRAQVALTIGVEIEKEEVNE